MIKIYVFISFLIISSTYVFSEAADPEFLEECADPNAEYLTCKRCVGSCDLIYPSCSDSCDPPGCYCKQGFVRKSESNNTCVPKSVCYNCRPNEEYQSCGSMCPDTCAEANIGGPPRPCSSGCNEGCLCKPGYLRIVKNGKCIPVKDCPGICPKNEEYNACGTACPTTCKNKDNLPSRCTKNCVAGCFCKKGYVRDEASKKCVRPKDCPIEPKTCKKNEVWLKKCANYQDTCETSYNPELGFKPGCCCKNGYVREFTGGKCIRREDCCEDDYYWD